MSKQYVQLSWKELDEAVRNYIQLRNPDHWVRSTVQWNAQIWKGKLESLTANVQATDDHDQSPDYDDILEKLALTRNNNE